MIDLFNRKALAEAQETNRQLQERIAALENVTTPAKQPEPPKPAAGTNTAWQPFRVRRTWRELRAAKEASLNSRARNALKLQQEIEQIQRGVKDVHEQEREELQ